MRKLTSVVAAGIAFGIAAPAHGSQLIDRNANNIKLRVSKSGVAQISYTTGGKSKKVLAWGALNATIATTASAKQQLFTVNYGNGHGSKYEDLGKHFVDACRKYDGPLLHWVVASCKAPDGSYWVLQSWQRLLADWGHESNSSQKSWELRLSHFKGALPILDLHQDWSYAGRYEHFFGKFTYLGKPLYGFKTDKYGSPLDKFGVLIYLDTYDSAYGKGWWRETGWVTHKGSGVFCYSMNPHGAQPAGSGKKYRITVQSPGALPDVYWQGVPIGPYNKAVDDQMNELQRTKYSSSACKIN